MPDFNIDNMSEFDLDKSIEDIVKYYGTFGEEGLKINAICAEQNEPWQRSIIQSYVNVLNHSKDYGESLYDHIIRKQETSITAILSMLDVKKLDELRKESELEIELCPDIEPKKLPSVKKYDMVKNFLIGGNLSSLDEYLFAQEGVPNLLQTDLHQRYLLYVDNEFRTEQINFYEKIIMPEISFWTLDMVKENFKKYQNSPNNPLDFLNH